MKNLQIYGRTILGFVLCLWAFSFAQAAESELVDTGRVNAQLISTHDDVAPGQEFYVALRKVIDPKWHTYWVNPGDSGEPVQINWDLPSELTPGEIIWPLPEAIPTGPLTNYGFENEVYFPVPFKVSSSAKPGDVLEIKANIFYLVCYDVCIPEDTSLSFSVLVGEPKTDPNWLPAINGARSDAPAFGPASGGVINQDGQAVFRFKNLPKGDYSESYFFPESGGMIEHAAPQKVTVTDQGLQLKTKAGFEWNNGQPELTRGVLAFKDDQNRAGFWVDLTIGSAPDVGAAIDGAAAGPGTDVPSGTDGGGNIVPAGPKIGFWGAVIGALMGGLILNIMPCVFPIVSLKALSVAKSGGGDMAVIRRDAWAYTLGVLLSFIALASVLLALKAGGAQVGWAFHLQNPIVVGFLALLLFAIGLNLLGIFEITGNFQGVGQDLTQKSGVSGSFFTGVLAVIVATPCMAPFMASAVGYALTQSAITSLTIFLMLGLGFALPYLLIAYIPAISRNLPRPGDWMVRFKEFLAFPMLAAAIWLVWVLNHQTGPRGVMVVLGAMLAVAFAVWLLKRKPAIAKLLAGVSILTGAAMMFTLHTQKVTVTGETWSAEKVQELRQDGQAVFVDFTASWCVPCKINDAAVLKQADILEDFAKTNTAFLVADWTNHDPVIGQELEKYGRAGVPLYLLFPPLKDDGSNKNASPEILPQFLTKSMVRQALEKNSR